MEIKLLLGDKSLVMPKFDFRCSKDRKSFVIAVETDMISIEDFKIMESDFDSAKTVLKFRGDTVLYEAQSRAYYFSLGDSFKEFPVEEEFELAIVFINSGGNIVDGEYDYFEISLKDYEDNHRYKLVIK